MLVSRKCYYKYFDYKYYHNYVVQKTLYLMVTGLLKDAIYHMLTRLIVILLFIVTVII